MNREWALTTRTYQIRLTVEEMLKINNDESWGNWKDETLYDQIMKLKNVFKCNYDGMFGAYIWVTFDYNMNVDDKKQVNLIIDNYFKE